MTPSELRLWSALSARKLGVQFRREVADSPKRTARATSACRWRGATFVDFCAPSTRLVVEVDGECHAERVGADARRDAALRALGYRVVRIEAALVMRDLPAAVALIRAAL